MASSHPLPSFLDIRARENVTKKQMDKDTPAMVPPTPTGNFFAPQRCFLLSYLCVLTQERVTTWFALIRRP